VATNHWGWTPRGVSLYLRLSWNWFGRWGVERDDGSFARRYKVGLLCFGERSDLVPGAALICYETAAERGTAKARLRTEGCRVDGERALCK
jgi:hypothetical protein